MQMKAAVFVGDATTLAFEELKPNPPGPRDVVVEVGASGVCHSDLSIMRGYVPLPPGMVLGHEGAGRVVEAGAEVSRVKKGDRVIASFVPACGTCWPCMQDQSELCDREAEVSAAMRGTRPDGTPYFCMTGLGTFSEVMTVDEASVVKVETDLPDAQLALIGCGVTTGVGAALNTAHVKPGASVAVLGCGGVGQAVIQGARIAGARQIIAVDIVAKKLDIARTFGATHTVLTGDAGGGVDPVKEIKKLSNGGVDYAFDAVGNATLAAQCLYALAPRGLAVIVGAIPRGQTLTVEPGHFFVEKMITGSSMGSNHFHIDAPHYLELYRQGRLDLDSMISERMPLEDIDKAFAAMQAGEVTRSVITFDN
jgi:S-(hydroxymethyl)glutathione dehydrogenase/alcohol dehydrogenase